MLEIWRVWFGQGVSIPVFAMHLTFLGLGTVLGGALRRKRTAIAVMSVLVLLCAVCALLMLTDSEMLNVFAVYLGAMFSLIFFGALIGMIIERIKRCRNEKGS